MDVSGSLKDGPNAALVFLTFLQADCRDPEYGKELSSLRQELNFIRDINANSSRGDEEGALECDGHQSSTIKAHLGDLQPSVDWPRNQDHANVLQVAEELREIAALLEHNVVVQATQNLSRNLSNSAVHQWKEHLIQEVDRVMRHGVGLEHLAEERVIMALTLTLVKGVCERAPRLLRSLFNIALQCVGGGGNG